MGCEFELRASEINTYQRPGQRFTASSVTAPALF
jgi:hypothetical protein